MNIVGHITIGITGTLITGDTLFLVGSLLPDVALIPNELQKTKFNKWKVKYKFLYDLTHSIYFVVLTYLINPVLSLGVLIHVLVDIPFHTSSFRWKPFLLNRYKSKRKVLLLSGGADSIACAFLEKDFDCVYFNYGQKYHEQEYECAVKVAKKLKKPLIVIHKRWRTDIQNRNYYFITTVKRMGYDEVIVGNRNLFPLLDKYKDSNWFNLKILQYLLKIYINMPIVGNFKWQVIDKIPKNVKYYSTENL
jgi:hypothetical protein